MIERWVRERTEHIQEAKEALAQQAGGEVSFFGFPLDVGIGESPFPRLQSELAKASCVLLLVEPLLFTPVNSNLLDALEKRLSLGNARLVPILLLTCAEEMISTQLGDGHLKAALGTRPLDLRTEGASRQGDTARRQWEELAREIAPRPAPEEPDPTDQTARQPSQSPTPDEQLHARIGALEAKLEQALSLLQRLADREERRSFLTIQGAAPTDGDRGKQQEYLDGPSSYQLVKLLVSSFDRPELLELAHEIGDGLEYELSLPSSVDAAASDLIAVVSTRTSLLPRLRDRLLALRPGRTHEIMATLDALRTEAVTATETWKPPRSSLIELILSNTETRILPSDLPGSYLWRWEDGPSPWENATRIADALIRARCVTGELLEHLKRRTYAQRASLTPLLDTPSRLAAAAQLQEGFGDGLELCWALRIGPDGDRLWATVPQGGPLAGTARWIAQSLDARGCLEERLPLPWYLRRTGSGQVPERPQTPRERVAGALWRAFRDRGELRGELGALISALSEDPVLVDLPVFRGVSSFTTAAQVAWLLDALGLYEDEERARVTRRGASCPLLSLLDRLAAERPLWESAPAGSLLDSLDRLVLDRDHLLWILGTCAGLDLASDLGSIPAFNARAVRARLLTLCGWDLSLEPAAPTLEALCQRLRWQITQRLQRSSVDRWTRPGVDRWDALVRLALDHRGWLRDAEGFRGIESGRELHLVHGLGDLAQIERLLSDVARRGLLPDLIRAWAEAVPDARRDLRHFFPDLADAPTPAGA